MTSYLCHQTDDCIDLLTKEIWQFRRSQTGMPRTRIETVTRVKRKLAAALAMVVMGPISFYRKLKIEQDCKKKTMKLSQPVYINKVLQELHLDKANPINTLIKGSNNAVTQRQRWGFSKQTRDIPRNGRLYYAIGGWNATEHRLCQKPKPSIHRGGGNNRQISKGLTPQESRLAEKKNYSDWAGDKSSYRARSPTRRN